MIERVMLLDAVLDDREFTWLGPSMDKRRHFIRHLGDRLELEITHICCSATAQRRRSATFPDKLPIGVQPHAEPHVLHLPGDAPLADGLPAVPAAAHSHCSSVLFRWTIRLLVPRQLRKSGWPTCTPHASTWRRRSTRRSSRRWSGSSPSGNGSPNSGAGPADKRYLNLLKAYRTSEVSSALPTVARTIPEHAPDGRLTAHRRRHRTRVTGRSSASSCRGSTSISLPWLTSPDTNSRGRPGGRPRKWRLSPEAPDSIRPIRKLRASPLASAGTAKS